MIKALQKTLGTFRRPVLWVFVLALGVRLFACLNTYIIDPDGIQYIQQARSIFYHDWHTLTTCHIKFISPLPFMIAAVFTLLPDWIVAGRFISLLFSFATLLPLYFLLRRFFDQTIALVTLLVYALIPVFVSRSSDIMRDPLFWFLTCCGMLMFIRSLASSEARRFPLGMTLSCFIFVLAAWTRIEGAVFILGSGLYLAISQRNRRLQRLFCFSLPILLVGGGVWVGTLITGHVHDDIFRTGKIQRELTQFVSQYESVRDQLETLSKDRPSYFGEFLHRVRNITWMVPLASIFNTTLEAFFYPYALFFYVGWIGIGARWRRDKDIGYFVCLLVLALGVLYLHMLQTWLIYNRFLAIVILPGFLFVGCGIANVLTFIEKKFHLKPTTAVVGLTLFVLAFGLAKDLQLNHEDKIIYRQAGEIIAERKSPGQIVRIAGVETTEYKWILFYAHLNYPGSFCTRDLVVKIPRDYAAFIKAMRAGNIRYLLYEEKAWPAKAFDFHSAPLAHDFNVLGTWYHKDTGKLMLLELKDQGPASRQPAKKRTPGAISPESRHRPHDAHAASTRRPCSGDVRSAGANL